jgi:iron complex transport system permease protein
VLLLLALLALACFASLAWGVRDVSLGTVWQALVDPAPGDNDISVVREQRGPRTLLGLLAGLALGLAGALMQGLTRNPIADPGLLGLNSGASLAVVVAIAVLGLSDLGQFVWFSYAGAALAALLVYGAASLGWEGPTPVRLALLGAAVTASTTALIMLVLTTDRSVLEDYRFWSVGSLVNRDPSLAGAVAPQLAVGALLALLSARFLNAMALGEDVARGLGQSVRRGRLLVVVAVVLLSGSAVAMVGPIAFVGLVVPHLARGLVGPDYRWVLPLSALMGPLLLLAADVAGRLVVRPSELEAGLMVAAVGTPVLIWLVRSSREVSM